MFKVQLKGKWIKDVQDFEQEIAKVTEKTSGFSF